MTTSILYTCNRNNGVAIPAFKERKLSDLMPASVSDVAINAIRYVVYMKKQLVLIIPKHQPIQSLVWSGNCLDP